MTNIVRRAVNAIIRPPRKLYELSEIPTILQGDDNITYIRQPYEFYNKRNMKLVCSIYHSSERDTIGSPCVLYLHGNASSQLEGQFLVPNLCKYGITVFCFDFAGCGCSEGKYVSLGFFEKEDTEFLIDHLHSQFHLGPFILWGRSMGAATALLVDSPFVTARVSDSSFTSVADMCSSIAKSMHLPPLFVPSSLWILKKQVIKRAKFNMDDVSPISINREKEVPALFGHAESDQFIPFVQCQKLYNHYQTRDKYIMALEGGHNSKRSEEWIRFGVCFVFDTLGLKIENPVISTCRKLQEKIFHFSSFSAMMDAAGNEEVNNEFYADEEDFEEEEKNENKKEKKKKDNKKDKKDKKKKKNKSSTDHLTNSYNMNDGGKKKKHRRSLRLQELDLKHNKKYKNSHNDDSDFDDDNGNNSIFYKKDEKGNSNTDNLIYYRKPNKNQNYKLTLNADQINYNKFILGENNSSDKFDETFKTRSLNKASDDSLLKFKIDTFDYNKFILGEDTTSDNNSTTKNDESLNKTEIDINDYNKFILGESTSSDKSNENISTTKNDESLNKTEIDINDYNKFILGESTSSDKPNENNSTTKNDESLNKTEIDINDYNKFILGGSSSSEKFSENNSSNKKENEDH